jgi:Protein of unknown function (DUF3568)
MSRKFTSWLLLLAATGLLAGCIAAAAAGAGAGGGIYFTTRGAEAVVSGSVDEVEARARAVMAKEGIAIDESAIEKGGDKRLLKGNKGDLTVTIEIKRETPKTSKTEVSARKNVVEWDKGYAKKILNQIAA